MALRINNLIWSYTKHQQQEYEAYTIEDMFMDAIK
jgi:hypothetical protein